MSECSCSQAERLKEQLLKLESPVVEMADAAKRLLKTAGDPFSAVIRFLHERPENVIVAGQSVKEVLLESFGSRDEIPILVRLLSDHVHEVIRQANVIRVDNAHTAQEMWGGYLIKIKEKIKFEVGKERDRLVLKDIAGLFAVEHGIEVPLEKILVNPPKLEITLRLGLLRPQRVVDIL